MRTFSEGRFSRAIAYLLTVTFLWSIGIAGLATAPASAQIVTRAATTQSVAVVPFDNLSPLRPETLGEEASAAVAVELRDRLLLDVLPTTDITLQMSDLGMVPPLSDVEMVRLAAEMDVALVVAGQVRAARIARDPNGRFAEVLLAVRLFDRLARANVNGALVQAAGPASPDASDESLIEKALAQAAFQAVEQMRSRPTITAMVLWAKENSVFLNVGSRGGLRPDMEMVAIRAGERIGRVKIVEADAIGSLADIVEGPPLRAGDHLRAVYELPRDPRVAFAPVKKERKGFRSVLTLAGLLLGLGLSSAGSRARLLAEGNIAAPFFAVGNLANGAELGLGAFFSPVVLITWESLGGIPAQRLIGYVMLVDGHRGAVIILGDTKEEIFTDMDMPFVFVEGNIEVDPVTGGFTWSQTEGTWDPDQDPPEEVWEVGDTTVDWLIRLDDGPFAGISFLYRFHPIIIEQVQVAAGVFEWRLKVDTEATDFQTVVPVSPALTTPVRLVFAGFQDGVYEIWDAVPNPEIDLVRGEATFFFYTPSGHDELILQVTRDPNITFEPALNFEVVEQGESLFFEDSITINLSDVPGSSNIFWWRIGAHNRRNETQPRPVPLDLPNEEGWVWSERLSFDALGGGSGREAARRRERDLLMRTRATTARARGRRGDRVLRAE